MHQMLSSLSLPPSPLTEEAMFTDHFGARSYLKVKLFKSLTLDTIMATTICFIIWVLFP